MSDDERPDLNAVLEHYGANTQDRRNYMTSCVFHEDRKPSLSVNTDRQLYKCQSCGKGGDVFTLIMDKEKCNFRGAIEFAASLGLATGGPGGGDGELRGSSYGPGRRSGGAKASRSRDRPKRGGYVPAWRRS